MRKHFKSAVIGLVVGAFIGSAAEAGTTIWGSTHRSVSATNRIPVDTSSSSGPGYNLTTDIVDTMSGDCTSTAAAVTCTKTNGTAFSALATTVPGTGVATALGVNVGSAGAFITYNGNAGTPSALVGTNITGTAPGLTAGNVTTNANLTGPITSSGNATSIANSLCSTGLSCTSSNVTVANNELLSTIGATFNGSGSAITSGSKTWVYVPWAGTINNNTITCDQSGSIQFDVQTSTYSGFPGSLASIVSSDPPAISSAQKSQDSTLTGWTTSFSAGTVVQFSVTSATTVTNCTIVLQLTRT